MGTFDLWGVFLSSLLTLLIFIFSHYSFFLFPFSFLIFIFLIIGLFLSFPKKWPIVIQQYISLSVFMNGVKVLGTLKIGYLGLFI